MDFLLITKKKKKKATMSVLSYLTWSWVETLYIGTLNIAFNCAKQF